MGSKTPEGHQQKPEGGSVKDQKPKIVAKSRSGSFPNDDLGGSDDEGDDEDGGQSEDLLGMSGNPGDAEKKKKKKKKNKCKKTKKKSGVPELKQTSPPRILLSRFFPSGEYPHGEIQLYNENLARVTAEETRANDRMDSTFLSDYRQAAEIHRSVRKWAQTEIKPGKSLLELAEGIEDGVRALTGHQGLELGDAHVAGMGFPTGLCLNNTAAHWTPNPSQKNIVLKSDDVLSVDFGVHVNGRIVDSAFTVAFDPVYDNLLQSVEDATNTGVKNAGIDARMSEIGASIQEVMESFEVEIKGKTYPVKAVRNLTGHDIKQYSIHGDKQVPFIKNSSRQKMEEGEVFAIETFGSTGRGIMMDDPGIYGYGRQPRASTANLHHASAKALLKTIDDNFGTIVFCRRYLERLGVKNYLPAMRTLISHGIVHDYTVLSDIKGSYVAQFEHTILLRSSGKEVISRGDDY